MQELNGTFYGQKGNPFAYKITLNNGACNYCFDVNWCNEMSYSLDNFCINFSNGNIGNIKNENSFYFSESYKVLTPNYKDCNNDGWDDTDSTLHEYTTKFNEWYFEK
jgi:hypothetical protein